MIFNHLFELEAAMANHIWQSTVFLLCVALLSLLLRKNQARIRYALWLAASMKFLVPFSLLTSFGGHLAPGNLTEPGSFYFVMGKMSRPFSEASPLLPASLGLALIWFVGCVTVIALFSSRWLRATQANRSALPLSEGPEVEALHRLQQAKDMRRPISIRYSQSSMEPGVFGIFRPVLLWPERLSTRLSDAHVEAILDHELEHVRRWDNLTATLHMLVQALFWFHPLVWWLGARLIDERERACDEAVLQSVSAPQIYAESILKTCEFSVATPVACVSGVTGGDLKQRIVRIMSSQAADRLGLAKKSLLVAICLSSIAGPVMIGAMAKQIYKIGAPGVSAPRLVYAPDPEYSQQARDAKYQGVCVLSLVIDEEGKTKQIKVERRLGMGLDQKAIEAVKQYKFTPAMLNKKPVPVAVHIEVNFKIY